MLNFINLGNSKSHNKKISDNHQSVNNVKVGQYQVLTKIRSNKNSHTARGSLKVQVLQKIHLFNKAYI